MRVTHTVGSGERRSRRLGMTLVEIMVVIAIIGVLSSVGMVSFSDAVIRANLATEANTIEARLRQGRLVARMERRCVVVVTRGNRIDILPLAHGAAPPADCEGGAPIENRDLGATLPEGIQLSDTRFYFDRAGGVVVGAESAREGGGVDLAVTIRARGVPGRTFIVRLLAGTGAISRFG
jgi:prepilin-type N-terminal cleavage/methylation domain-containing protein